MKTAVIATLLLLPLAVSANNVQPKATKVKLADASKTCVFKDKTYSVGTTLKNNGVTLECIAMTEDDEFGKITTAMWKLKTRK